LARDVKRVLRRNVKDREVTNKSLNHWASINAARAPFNATKRGAVRSTNARLFLATDEEIVKMRTSENQAAARER
jgi:hypothetical protein